MFKMRSSCSIYRYQIVIAFDARTSGKPTPDQIHLAYQSLLVRVRYVYTASLDR